MYFATHIALGLLGTTSLTVAQDGSSNPSAPSALSASPSTASASTPSSFPSSYPLPVPSDVATITWPQKDKWCEYYLRRYLLGHLPHFSTFVFCPLTGRGYRRHGLYSVEVCRFRLVEERLSDRAYGSHQYRQSVCHQHDRQPRLPRGQ